MSTQNICNLCFSLTFFQYIVTRSLGALRAHTSSKRPFGSLDFVLRALRPLRLLDPHPTLHCVFNSRWEIGIFNKMSTSPLIFFKINYFRQKYLEIVLCSVSLLKHIWVEVEHSILPRQTYKRISCNSSRSFGIYLQISNSIFTVFLAPLNKK